MRFTPHPGRNARFFLGIVGTLLIALSLGMTCEEYAELPMARDFDSSPLFDQSGTLSGGVIPWYIEYKGSVDYQLFYLGKFGRDPVNHLEDAGHVQMNSIRMRLGVLWTGLMTLTLPGVRFTTTIQDDIYADQQRTEDWDKIKNDLVGAVWFFDFMSVGEGGDVCTEGEYGGPFWPPTDWFIICGTVDYTAHLYLPYADLELFFAPHPTGAQCFDLFKFPPNQCNEDEWRHRIP